MYEPTMLCLNLSALKLLHNLVLLEVCCRLLFESDNDGDVDWPTRFFNAEKQKNRVKKKNYQFPSK